MTVNYSGQLKVLKTKSLIKINCKLDSTVHHFYSQLILKEEGGGGGEEEEKEKKK